jgi:hypothetical protein
VLRTIEAISTGAWPQLAEIPFSELTLTFSTGQEIKVYQNDDGLRISRTGYDTLPWSRQHLWTLQNDILNYLTNTSVATALPSAATFLAGPALPWKAPMTTYITTPTKVPTLWTNEIFRDFPVLYVSDDRLVTGLDRADDTEARPGIEPIRARSVVEEAAQDIASVIEGSLADYAQHVQAIDRDFPSRVISALESDEYLTDASISQLLDEINARRDALQRVGILPEHEAALEDLNLGAPNARTVIRVFAEDILRKLDTLEPLRARLELFTDFLNRHYRRKRVVLDGKNGAIFVDTETEEPQRIPPSSLSSGEQHILVLAHRVLFSAGAGTLVLIDEPELSLHVLWQDTFVDDMNRMGRENNLSFLFATHSPTLVAGRDDLRRALDLS